jgi:hypothetical protein
MHNSKQIKQIDIHISFEIIYEILPIYIIIYQRIEITVEKKDPPDST